MDMLATLLATVIGASVVTVGGVAVASRFSRRVHVMLWGE